MPRLLEQGEVRFFAPLWRADGGDPLLGLLDGSQVEHGTHADLLARAGRDAERYGIQAAALR